MRPRRGNPPGRILALHTGPNAAMPIRRWEDRLQTIEARDPRLDAGAYGSRPSLALDSERLRRELALGERGRRFSTRILVFLEKLARAEAPAGVFGALASEAPALVHGFVGLVFSPGSAGTDLFPEPGRILGVDVGAIDSRRLPTPLTCETATEASALERAGMTSLVPLLGPGRASSVAYAHLEGSVLLVLLERRRDALYDGDDLYVLRALARQAELALARLARA